MRQEAEKPVRRGGQDCKMSTNIHPISILPSYTGIKFLPGHKAVQNEDYISQLSPCSEVRPCD